ncbi:MAG: head decoration protein [Deltaproteobacteria bacterium]|nr:head decoration protein [Deltaproteobacteria bacterium]
MAQDFGINSVEYQDKPFLGDHPPIIMPGTLLSGQNLVSGTVVGVVTSSGKKMILTPGASDGSQNAAAVLLGDLDAGSGDEPGVFVEHGVVMDMYLTWPSGITAPQKTAAIAQLKSAGVFVK